MFKLANMFHTQHGRPLLVPKRDGTGTRIDGNRLLTSRYKRPMMGYAGDGIWVMLEERDKWVRMLLEIKNNVGNVIHSDARVDAVIAQLALDHELLKQVFALEPTHQEVSTFGARALAMAQNLVHNFPDYKFAPYDHWLVEHMWEFMEYWGGVGKLSSIICEAANALWKSIEDGHVAGNVDGVAREMMAFTCMAVSTHPIVSGRYGN